MRWWIFHILFWLFVGAYTFDYLIDLYGFWQTLWYSLFEVATYSTEFYINMYVLLPQLLLARNQRAGYAVAVLFLLVAIFGLYWALGMLPVLLSDQMGRAVITFSLNHFLFILMSYFGWFYEQFFLEKQRRLQLENDQLRAEMVLLKSQISPHFLFNSLNNIYTLSLLKSDDAPKMIALLADILRYLLYEGEKERVLLSEEIKLIQNYLKIQEYRKIAGWENIDFSVKGDLSSIKIPPLILITLVENAFKHGDVIANKKGFVNIKLINLPTEKKLSVYIENSFRPKDSKPGLGLSNIRSQLKILFGKHHHLDIQAKENIYKVLLEIDL